jgi:hypothetical protein
MMRQALRQLGSLLPAVARQQPALGEAGTIVLLPPQILAPSIPGGVVGSCQGCQGCQGASQHHFYSTTAIATSSSQEQSQGALVAIDPTSREQQLQISLDGKRLKGVPGSYKYTAPYLLPEELRQGVPRVLLADPWVSVQDRETVKSDLHRLLSFLRQRMDQPMLAYTILQEFNKQAAASGQPRLPGTGYTRRLLEQLRNNRFIIGKKNPNSPRPLGHPDYSYLYTALPYQADYKGPPSRIAPMLEKKRQDWVKLGLARVRRGKPPFPIHRPVAHTSVYQHALGYEAMYQALEQRKQLQQEGSSAGAQQQGQLGD